MSGRDPRATAVLAVLAAWWLAMAAGNRPGEAGERFRDRDRWGSVVPNWQFFAPSPVSYDRHLLCRVVRPDRTTGVWHEAAAIPRRAWRHALWHPERRRHKTLGLVTQKVGIAATAGDPGTVLPELQLLRSIAEHAVHEHERDVDAYQFAIVRTTGEGGERGRTYLSPVLPAR